LEKGGRLENRDYACELVENVSAQNDEGNQTSDYQIITGIDQIGFHGIFSL
jgi:hypothetical protein